jgi:hypothetical protein
VKTGNTKPHKNDPPIAREAGDTDLLSQIEPIDELLDLAAHRAVADDHQLEVVASIPQPGRRPDQDRLPLLLGDRAPSGAVARLRGECRCPRPERRRWSSIRS